jgi:hypothetical protein
MNAQYNARTGSIIAVWAQRELRKKKMLPRPIICDTRNNGLFWIIFEDLRRDKAKFFLSVLECLCTLEEMQETIVCVLYPKQTNMRRCEHPERERKREGGINTQVECLINHLY